MPTTNDGVMIILSSPSGAGKTTLVNLLSKLKNFDISISHTTREPRPNEIPNKDYYFVNEDKFKRLVKNEEFLEYAKVFKNYYGTTRTPVIDNLNKGKNVLFDIDWQGTQQLMNSLQDDLVKVFVLPPSAKELEKRLLKRNQDTNKTVKDRMSKASNEISHYAEYDYIIVNEDFEDSLVNIESILVAEGLKRSRQLKIQEVINNLLNDL